MAIFTDEQKDYLDANFKRKDDCETEMKSAEEKHHSLDNRLVKLETGQTVNNWLTGIIAGGIIALVIKVFLGG